MTSETIQTLSIAVSLVLVAALICGAALAAWRGWLALKRLELDAGRGRAPVPVNDDGIEDTGALIEIAAVKERLRRLEAIANGVEL